MTADFISHCPWCGKHFDAATCVGEDAAKNPLPENGDLSLCIACGEWAVFERKAKGGQRKPNKEEYNYIIENNDTRLLRETWFDTVGNKRKRLQ